jgi:hypothetical protein
VDRSVTSTKLVLGLICGFVVFGAPARASVIYDFWYSETAPSIQNFFLTFTAPGYVTAGQIPTFVPFGVTDGTTNWTMTQSLATPTIAGGHFCFEFGTATNSALGTGCGVGAYPPNGGSLLFDFTQGPALPTADGFYYGDGVFISGTNVDGYGNVALGIVTIPTPTPEPRSGIFLLSSLFLAGFLARKQFASLRRTPGGRFPTLKRTASGYGSLNN